MNKDIFNGLIEGLSYIRMKQLQILFYLIM